MKLYKSTNDFKYLIKQTSEYCGYSEAIVEKDYYVTEVLKSVCNKQKNIVFKGGTCLSKCFKKLALSSIKE